MRLDEPNITNTYNPDLKHQLRKSKILIGAEDPRFYEAKTWIHTGKNDYLIFQIVMTTEQCAMVGDINSF